MLRTPGLRGGVLSRVVEQWDCRGSRAQSVLRGCRVFKAWSDRRVQPDQLACRGRKVSREKPVQLALPDRGAFPGSWGQWVRKEQQGRRARRAQQERRGLRDRREPPDCREPLGHKARLACKVWRVRLVQQDRLG